MKKKIFTLVITIIFIVTGIDCFAQTEADFIVTLTEDGNGVVITGYSGSSTAVRIPSTIQGFPVREIGGAEYSDGFWNGNGAFMGNDKITSVVVPEGVTIIRAGAFGSRYGWFGGCEKLAQVTLPSTLQVIERGAFEAAKALKTIVIPEGVTKIGSGAFRSCSSLSSVTLPKSLIKLGSYAFGDGFSSSGPTKDSPVFTSIILPPNLTKIKEGTFRNCTKLTSIVIPEGVTEIASHGGWGEDGPGAFAGCIALTSVTLPSSIEVLGEGAFYGCTALTTVNIPETVEIIYGIDSAFQKCIRLNLVTQALIRRLTVGRGAELLAGKWHLERALQGIIRKIWNF